MRHTSLILRQKLVSCTQVFHCTTCFKVNTAIVVQEHSKRFPQIVERHAGHSLGGALANLAAYDICKHAQEAGWQHVKVLCYTFGAPRVGNHAFATDYNGMVPDTWSVINDQASRQFSQTFKFTNL